MVISEAKKKADKKYAQKNPEKRKRYVAKSQAKKFIEELATIEDLKILREMIDNKIIDLENNK